MSSAIIKEKIKQSILKSVPIAVTTYKFAHDFEVQIDEIIAFYLEELGQKSLKDHLSYCVKELAVNAKKANTKRIYFAEKKLNLHDDKDYQEGMKKFKEETLDNYEFWLDLQKKKGLFIKFLFHPAGKNFKITIKNNVEITRHELTRVYDRIARSRTFETLEEAFSEVLDDSEGAGLGIVILILMLRKMGLGEDNFEIEADDGITTSSITVPISEAKIEKFDILIDQIVHEIDQLPQFPENIIAIQRLISNPDSDIKDIARKISTDPSLTAGILRSVNSAKFMLPNKVDNIVDAVKMLGLRGVRNMLYSYGTEKTLNLPSHPELWKHAHRVAFYSFTLARQTTKNKDICDEAYVGGILHDIGKIVFSALHPDLMSQIRKFSSEKDIAPSLLEDLSAGYDHAEIGAKIAEKWNFTDSLIEIIRYHHDPHSCSQKNRHIVFCVYLGNALSGYESGEYTYELLNHNILKKFNITSEDQIKNIIKHLSAAHEKELSIVY